MTRIRKEGRGGEKEAVDAREREDEQRAADEHRDDGGEGGEEGGEEAGAHRGEGGRGGRCDHLALGQDGREGW